MYNDGRISLRRLIDCDNDYILLEKWCSQEEIYLHFEQRKLNLSEIKNKYYPRTLDDADIPVYVISYDDIPIGIIQYQLINDEDKLLYGVDCDKCYEIDLFIGKLDYQNMGIGRNCIRMVSNYLFEDKFAELLVLCPLKSNVKAINCYLKSDFVIKKDVVIKNTIGELKTYTLMTREKIDF
jgi:aminoglycoside 6'-N-acetyltransferase